MTRKLIDFVAANVGSPVVYGSTIGAADEPTGCFYRLANGRSFRLTTAELRRLPPGCPRWSFDPPFRLALLERKAA